MAAQQLQELAAQVAALMNQNATITSELNDLRRQNQSISQENVQVRAEAAAANQRLAETVPNVLESIQEAVQGRNRGQRISLVDPKGIGKPQVFHSEEAKFRPWAKKTESFITSIFPELEPVFEWAVDHEGPISIDDVDTAFVDEDTIDDVHDKSMQVYSALNQLCDGESWDIVQNSGKNNGFEAWRKLHRRYDPSTGGRKRNLLKAIIGPSRCKDYNELGGALEQWEDLVSRYERKKNNAGEYESVSDDIKMAAMESMVPEDLEKHLLMQRARLNSYDLMREEVVSYVESVIGSKIRENINLKHKKDPNAMDVDALGKGGGKHGYSYSTGKGKGKDKGGKGKGKGKDSKGKGKGKSWNSPSAAHGGTGGGKGYPSPPKFEGYCDLCWKYGHKKADCWTKPLVNSYSYGGSNSAHGGVGQGKGKYDKGKGKGKSAGSVEETQQSSSSQQQWQPEQEQGAQSTLDLCIVENGNVVAEHENNWLKLNFDTGAAATTFPKTFVDNVGEANIEKSYKTASGEIIYDYGGVGVTGYDENGTRRRLTGRLADVHKPLVSGHQICTKGRQDAWLGSDGGYLMPRDGPIAVGLRNHFDKLIKKHGTSSLIPLYIENNVYNFYIKKTSSEPIRSLAIGANESSPSSTNSGGSASSSGNGRQVKP